jgi:AsmA-like C-terminal region/AsmA family
LSNTLTEPIVRVKPVERPAVARPRWRRWANIVALFLALLWIANIAISLAIRHTSLQSRITARLGAAFGRSVEVGSYRFSLWGRPTLEARSVTVSEDPRFGHEYFLRAESLTMSLRWRSLLRGRLEFGGIWLGHPSLNLVRNPDGDWNVAEWLPQFSAASGSRAAAAPKFLTASNALRFSRIHVDSGRINFKRSQEKLPFALVGVTGYVEPEGNGEWRLDLEAAPARAAVILQQAGMLHLSGRVGGTSSRLRPAALDFAWTDASLSDALRLVRATDYGVRGNLAIVLKASTQAQDWNLEGRAEIRQVHRWNLPLRADNPSLNLLAKGILDPELARFDFVNSTLETPRSNAHATGAISWNRASVVDQVAPRFITPKNSESDTSLTTLQIVSSAIDASDLLAWARAFHSGISDEITVRGFAKLKASVTGWPPRIDEGTLSLGETDLTAKTLAVPVRLASASLLYDSKGAFISPAVISFGAAGGTLRVETQGSIGLSVKNGSPGLRSISPAQAASALHISGGLADVGNLISTVRLLGWDISRGWDLTGPVRGDLRWQGSPYPWKSPPTGSLDFGASVNTLANADANTKSSGDSLRAPFLNLPVEQIRAHVDLKGAARHVALTSAEAFGAHWTGSLDRRESDPMQALQVLEEQPSAEQPQQKDRWQFALSADRLSAADGDRWLNPRWRQSFIDRVLPFLNSRPPAAAQPDNLLATGKINVDQFALVPFMLHHVQTDATIDGRRLNFSNVRAQLAKGDVTGSLRADLDASPSYRLNLDYSAVDLYVLTAATSSLADRFAGVASGKISLSATGGSRSDLISSLQCRGTSRITGAELMNIDLTTSFADGAFRPGHTTFRDASADFTCDSGKIEFQRLRLSGPTEGFTGQGIVDFSRNIDFKFAALSDSALPRAVRASDSPSPSYRLSGDLSEPAVTRVKQASSRR